MIIYLRTKQIYIYARKLDMYKKVELLKLFPLLLYTIIYLWHTHIDTKCYKIYLFIGPRMLPEWFSHNGLLTLDFKIETSYRLKPVFSYRELYISNHSNFTTLREFTIILPSPETICKKK